MKTILSVFQNVYVYNSNSSSSWCRSYQLLRNTFSALRERAHKKSLIKFVRRQRKRASIKVDVDI